MRRCKSVAVLMGGPSEEREISLTSGRAVARGLREAGYDVVEAELAADVLELPAGCDAVFVALHGRFGEDGTVQRMLAERGIPYTGSGPEASRLAFDKVATKERLIERGIPTPPFQCLRAVGDPQIPLPCVVKPRWQGSSIGLHYVEDDAQWEAALEDALRFDGEVLAEEFVSGREFTVGMVGDQVLPVVEVHAPKGRFDFEAKYTKGRSEYRVPAPLSDEETSTCQRLAEETFDALGCRGLGRIDVLMNDGGQFFVLELNNIPGFTETSLLPLAAAAVGISFPDLCGRIVESAAL